MARPTSAHFMNKPGRFLTAEWRDLVLLNYEVDASALAKRVPPGTELDPWQGRILVSMVGFRFTKTRIMGFPIPFHSDFDEVNLRFYVRRAAADGVRRGVVFIKEIVPLRAIAWMARAFYSENYIALPMRHAVALPSQTLAMDGARVHALAPQRAPAPQDAPIPMERVGRATYEWRFRERWNRLTAEVEGPASTPATESEEEFITEHYWGYALQRDGTSLEYQVEHPRWCVWRTSSAELECDVEHLYGPEFSESLARSPRSAFVADGSPVVVRRGVPLG